MTRLVLRTALLLMLLAQASGAAAQGDRYGAQSAAERRYAEGRQLELEAERYGDSDAGLDLYEKAARRYAQAIDREPDFLAAYVRFGYAMYVLKRSDEAVKLMRVAHKKDPADIDIIHQLGLNLLQVGEREEAIRLLDQVSNARADRPDVEFILGKHRLEQERYDDAVRHFERYRALNPQDPQGIRALGTIYLRQQRYEEALTIIERLLAVEPDDITARANLGNALYALGRFDEALEAYDAASAADDDRFDVHYNAASAHHQLGDYDASLSSFQRAAELQPDSLAAWYFVGDTALLVEQPEVARGAFERVLELNEDYAYGHLRLGESHAALGQEEPALEHLGEARELRPEDPRVHHLSAAVYLELGRTEDALEAAAIATEIAPEEARYQLGLGDILRKMGRSNEAVLVYRNAIEDLSDGDGALLEPSTQGLSLSLLLRGLERWRAEEVEGAIKDFEEVRRIGAHALHARVNLAAIALSRGELKRARKLAERAAEELEEVGEPRPPQLERIFARLLVAEARYDEAEAAIKALEEEGTLTGEIWHDRALIAASRGDWGAAREALEAAEEAGVSAPRNLALVLYRVALEEASEDNWRQVDRLLDQAMRRRKAMSRVETTRVELVQAYAAFERGEWEEALEGFVEVIEDAESFSRSDRARLADGGLDLDALQVERARLLYALGRDAEAQALIERLNLKLGAIERSIHEHLGLDPGVEPEAAERHLRAALDGAEGEDAERLRFNIAVLEHRRGDTEGAAERFKALARRGVVEALLNYAIHLDEVAGEEQRAIEFYEKYVEAGGARADAIRARLERKRAVFGAGEGR